MKDDNAKGARAPAMPPIVKKPGRDSAKASGPGPADQGPGPGAKKPGPGDGPGRADAPGRPRTAKDPTSPAAAPTATPAETPALGLAPVAEVVTATPDAKPVLVRAGKSRGGAAREAKAAFSGHKPARNAGKAALMSSTTSAPKPQADPAPKPQADPGAKPIAAASPAPKPPGDPAKPQANPAPRPQADPAPKPIAAASPAPGDPAPKAPESPAPKAPEPAGTSAQAPATSASHGPAPSARVGATDNTSPPAATGPAAPPPIPPAPSADQASGGHAEASPPAADAGRGAGEEAPGPGTVEPIAGFVELNTKLFEFFRTQADATMSVWRATVTAGSLAEAVRVQTSGMRQVYESSAGQWKEVSETTNRVFADAFKAMRSAWTQQSR